MNRILAAAVAAMLSLASPAVAAKPCYDLGHVGNCPALKQPREACAGWRDAAGSCHWEPPRTHGVGGSGMTSGRGGYLGPCGAGTC
jgi:hypothetical protein